MLRRQMKRKASFEKSHRRTRIPTGNVWGDIKRDCCHGNRSQNLRGQSRRTRKSVGRSETGDEKNAQHLVLTASHAEKQNVNLKMEIKAMKGEIERIQATHSRHLKEKNEMWAICSHLQSATFKYYQKAVL